MPGWTFRHLRSAPTLTGTSKPSGSVDGAAGEGAVSPRFTEHLARQRPERPAGSDARGWRRGVVPSLPAMPCPSPQPPTTPRALGVPQPVPAPPCTVLCPRLCLACGSALSPQPQARNSSPLQTSGVTLRPGLMGGGVPAPRALNPRRGQLQAPCPLARPHSGNRPPHALGHVLRLPLKWSAKG